MQAPLKRLCDLFALTRLEQEVAASLGDQKQFSFDPLGDTCILQPTRSVVDPPRQRAVREL